MVEDESDVQAAKELRAEVRADVAEFDEAATALGAENGGQNADDASQVAGFTSRLEDQLKSIETEVR